MAQVRELVGPRQTVTQTQTLDGTGSGQFAIRGTLATAGDPAIEVGGSGDFVDEDRGSNLRLTIEKGAKVSMTGPPNSEVKNYAIRNLNTSNNTYTNDGTIEYTNASRIDRTGGRATETWVDGNVFLNQAVSDYNRLVNNATITTTGEQVNIFENVGGYYNEFINNASLDTRGRGGRIFLDSGGEGNRFINNGTVRTAADQSAVFFDLGSKDSTFVNNGTVIVSGAGTSIFQSRGEGTTAIQAGTVRSENGAEVVDFSSCKTNCKVILKAGSATDGDLVLSSDTELIIDNAIPFDPSASGQVVPLAAYDRNRVRTSDRTMPRITERTAYLTLAPSTPRVRGTPLTPAQIRASTLTPAKIRATKLTDAQIRASTLTPAQIKATQLTAAQIRAMNLMAAQIRATKLTDAQIRATKLTPAQIRATNLTPAQIRAMNLTAAQIRATGLTAADIRASTLTDAQIRAMKLTPAQIRATKLTAAQIRAMKLTTAQIRATDLTPAQIRAMKLTDAQIRATQLTDAQIRATKLTDAQLRATPLTNAKIRAMRLTAAQIRATQLTDAQIRAMQLTDAQIRATGLTAADIRASTLTDADIRAMKLTAAQIRATNLTAAQIRATNLTAAQIRAMTLTDAQIRATSLTPAQIRATQLTDAQIRAMQLTPAQIRATQLTDAQIRAMQLTDAQIRATGLTAADIRASTLTDAQIRAMKLTAAQIRATDLTAAQIRAMNLTAAQVRAVVLTPARMRAMRLSEAQIRAMNVTPAQIRATNLTPAQIRATGLTAAQFRAMQLTPAQFSAIQLTPAQIQAMALEEAQIRATGLTAAQVRAMQLTDAQIRAIGLDPATFVPRALTPAEASRLLPTPLEPPPQVPFAVLGEARLVVVEGVAVVVTPDSAIGTEAPVREAISDATARVNENIRRRRLIDEQGVGLLAASAGGFSVPVPRQLWGEVFGRYNKRPARGDQLPSRERVYGVVSGIDFKPWDSGAKTGLFASLFETRQELRQKQGLNYELRQKIVREIRGQGLFVGGYWADSLMGVDLDLTLGGGVARNTSRRFVQGDPQPLTADYRSYTFAPSARISSEWDYGDLTVMPSLSCLYTAHYRAAYAEKGGGALSRHAAQRVQGRMTHTLGAVAKVEIGYDTDFRHFSHRDSLTTLVTLGLQGDRRLGTVSRLEMSVGAKDMTFTPKVPASRMAGLGGVKLSWGHEEDLEFYLDTQAQVGLDRRRQVKKWNDDVGLEIALGLKYMF